MGSPPVRIDSQAKDAQTPLQSFWPLIFRELTPYPGRVWVVGRVTIAATIMMLLVMTFQLPAGFLGAIFTVFLTRENPMATFQAGSRAVLAFLIATAYTIVTTALFMADPMTHFLWVVFSLMIAFYLIRIIEDYGTAVAFGFMIAGSIPIWDEHTLNVNQRLESTLWTTFSVALGIVITIVVELVFRRIHPMTDLAEGLDARLATVEACLENAAGTQTLEAKARIADRLQLYSSVGVSRLRRLILRSDYSTRFKEQASAATSLVGRLMDITLSFHQELSHHSEPREPHDKERCLRLVEQIAALRRSLALRSLPEDIPIPSESAPSSLSFLTEMERTVAFIPKAFRATSTVDSYVPTPLDEIPRGRIFVSDALTNPAHLQFAIRGTLAAVACYVVYSAIDWTGLSTSLATCFVTALSTIGSSRQKQFLRLGGAILGGIVLGMGAQIFLLPYLDSIFGFTILFALVTAASAWISTASTRLSYLGVQMALAYYLINLQEFTIQTSLSIARDRIFGVLLGLFAMWLLFDRLWVRDALDEMRSAFTKTLDRSAEFAEELTRENVIESIQNLRRLRDQINGGFTLVTSQADAIVFEFGTQRKRKLEIRDHFRRWQASARTLLHLQVTLSQYRVKRSFHEISPNVEVKWIAFERSLTNLFRAMSIWIKGQFPAVTSDLLASSADLQQALRQHYDNLSQTIAPDASDIIVLVEDIVSVAVPLYDDIHTVCTDLQNPISSSKTPVFQQFNS